MEDVDTALTRLEALKDLGLRLAIDDLGTGYSSLSYLRNFPMDIVEIDKSFIDRITLDVEGEAMVRGVIDLSRALGRTTIAEGVERHDQFALLHDLGCDGVHGHLFAKPMPGPEFPGSLPTRPEGCFEQANGVDSWSRVGRELAPWASTGSFRSFRAVRPYSSFGIHVDGST